MKTCTSCGKRKALSEFYWTTRKDGKKARHSKCQLCRRLQFKAWAASPQGKRSKRNRVLRSAYGITRAQYEDWLTFQKGLCAICLKPETKIIGSKLVELAVDHDHQTGFVRGLLCQACNVGLGSFRDSPDRLRAAAQYLEW